MRNQLWIDQVSADILAALALCPEERRCSEAPIINHVDAQVSVPRNPLPMSAIASMNGV